MNLHSKSFLKWASILGIVVAIGILPGFSDTVWAHGDELGHEESSGSQEKEELIGPHGGQVVEFDKNYLEFTVDHRGGGITLFLLDEDLKTVPMSESYSGLIYLTMDDGSKKTLTLERGTEGAISHLEAKTGAKDIGSFKVVVSLKIGEKRQNLRFSWAPEVHDHEE